MNDNAENLLKKTAVTFASEAISSDLKVLLAEKIKYNLRVFNEINRLVQTIAQCKDKRIRNLLLKDSSIFEAIQAALDDQKSIIGVQNILLGKLLKEKEQIGLELENDSSLKEKEQ